MRSAGLILVLLGIFAIAAASPFLDEAQNKKTRLNHKQVAILRRDSSKDIKNPSE